MDADPGKGRFHVRASGGRAGVRGIKPIGRSKDPALAVWFSVAAGATTSDKDADESGTGIGA